MVNGNEQAKNRPRRNRKNKKGRKKYLVPLVKEEKKIEKVLRRATGALAEGKRSGIVNKFARVSRKVRGVVKQRIKNPLSRRIALGLANPIAVPNLRIIPTQTEYNPTSAMVLHRVEESTNQAVIGTYSKFTAGHLYVSLFRDAFRSLVQFMPNISSSTGTPTPYKYQFVFYQSESVPVATNQIVELADTTWDFDPLYATSVIDSTYTWAPHGPIFYSGLCDTQKYIWMDIGCVITFTFASSYTGEMTVYPFLGAEKKGQSIATVAISGTTCSYTSTAMGYYHFQFEDAVASGTASVSAIIVGNGDVFAHLSMPGVENHFMWLHKYRIDAASLLLSPTMQEIAKNGTIYGLCSSVNNVQWFENLDWTLWSSQASNSRYYWVSRAGKGGYTFLPPSDNCFDWNTNTGTLSASSYPSQVGYDLNSSNYYNSFVVSTANTTYPGVNGAYAAGCEYTITVVHSLEFIAPDQWIETHNASVDFNGTCDAMKEIAQMSVFYENPLHWNQITNFIRRGYNSVRNNAGKIAGGLSVLFPHFAPAFGAGAGLLRSLPEF